MVSKNSKKIREYNTSDYEQNDSTPYRRTEGKNKGKPILSPGLNTDMVSYSQSTGSRRGSGGRSNMASVGAAYMKAMENNYMDGTKDSLWRRYKRMDKDVDHLYKMKRISSISPAKWDENDVHNFLMYRRSLNLSDSEMIHEMAALANVLRFIGNGAFDEALRQYPFLRVSAVHKRLPSMLEDEYRAILEMANSLVSPTWTEMVSYATVVFAFSSGLRSKELRLCDVNDVKMHSDGLWTVIVRHPKGEGRYGEEREAPIFPDAYPFLSKYFAARSEHVRAIGARTHALFLGNVPTDGYLAGNTVRMYAARVSEALNIDMNLRTCRRTYGQRLVDMGVPISTVSVVMGHNSTRTTELSYARVKGSSAISMISQTFKAAESRGANQYDPQMPTGFGMSVVAPRETP